MKTINFVLILFALIISLSFNGCKKDKPKGPQPTEFEESMTSKDTVAVKSLVDKFFTYAKNKQFDDAAAMLYRNDERSDKEPQLLDNEEMDKVRGMLRSIPMVDYEIEYIKFNEGYANEVLCKVVMIKGENGQADVTTKMFFKPVMYMGTWLLCLTNSEYGDKGVIKPGKRDSVEKAYAKKDSTRHQIKEAK